MAGLSAAVPSGAAPQRAAVPFDGDSMLVAETLRTFRDFGFRVVAVDRSGAIDRSRYVAAGLCDGFLLPEELDAQLISPVRPPADT